ncbi:hypothetical protein ACWUKX_10655 [Mesorhizobium sp. f-mel]
MNIPIMLTAAAMLFRWRFRAAKESLATAPMTVDAAKGLPERRGLFASALRRLLCRRRTAALVRRASWRRARPAQRSNNPSTFLTILRCNFDVEAHSPITAS